MCIKIERCITTGLDVDEVDLQLAAAVVAAPFEEVCVSVEPLITDASHLASLSLYCTPKQ